MSEPFLPPHASVAQALAWAKSLGIDSLDAQMLLCHLLRKPRSWLIAHDSDTLPPEHHAPLQALAQRRADGEPLAYVLGEKEFYGLRLHVAPGVLVPRPDTETLVDWALSLIPQQHPGEKPFKVLDLGTGSGAIALALQQARPHAHVTATDASPAALAIASANAQALKLRVQFVHGHWFAPVAGEMFDLVVSNPPYIAEGDAHLAALTHEPLSALTSGPDGLDDIRTIVAQAASHLAPDGWLLLEHGFDQHQAVQQLLAANSWRQIDTRHDLAGHPRCTGAQRPRSDHDSIVEKAPSVNKQTHGAIISLHRFLARA